MMAHSRNLILTIALLAAAISGARAAEAIKIALNPETGQRIIAQIAGEALQEAGFAVEYVTVPVAIQYSQIAAGAVHVQPNASDTADSEDYKAAFATGKIADVGRTAAESGNTRSRKIIWTGVNGKWPGAAKLLRNMTLRSADLQKMAADVDEEGRDIDAVVTEWMAANRKRWKFWTAASTNWMKQ